MNQEELRQIDKQNTVAVKDVKGVWQTPPSPYKELPHPELLIFGIDGGVDSYIAHGAETGELPNFARLLKRGTRLTELRPAHPSITPACWSSIMTGATPEVNGILADAIHLGGTIADNVTCYHGDHLKAERLWEAAARIGKSSLVGYMPVTAPARSSLVRQYGGYAGVRKTYNNDNQEYYDVPLQLWFFDCGKKPTTPLKGFTQTPSPVTDCGGGAYRLEMKLDTEKCSNYRNIAPFCWNMRTMASGFEIDFEGEKLELIPGKWSKVVRRTLPTAKGELRIPFQFGCFAFEDGFLILSVETGDLSDVCTPELYKITQKLPPPPLDKMWTFYGNPAAAQISMDAANFQVDWLVSLLREALHEQRSDIVATYFPVPDTVNHFHWQVFSGIIPSTPEIKALAERSFREVYASADRFLGFLLDEVADEKTTILVVSDHGTIGHVADNDINKILADKGYLVWKDEAKRIIDCTKTRAAMRGCGHIYVNLKGRETGGIVPPEEYDKVVYGVIAALQDALRAPDGTPYLAFAVRKEEAGFFGLGGEGCGDVVYGLSSGYAAMTIHAEQIPGARSKYGSMLSLGILSGPGIPQNLVYDKPVRTVDLAPTLCALLGYPQPAQRSGCVLQALTGGKTENE